MTERKKEDMGPRIDTDAAMDAHLALRRQAHRELHAEVDLRDKLWLSALVLFVGLPAFAISGWFIFLASEERPWLMSFGMVLFVLFLVNWPLELWLKQKVWFKRMVGDGQFRQTILKFPTLYLPMLVIVGVNDLDHGRSVAENLREYALTITGFLILLVITEAALAAISRWWKARPKRQGARR